jgi:diacylglycerol kinase family enzyme
VQLDGDYIGTTPMVFEVVPRSLWALVPPGADRSLWRSMD